MEIDLYKYPLGKDKNGKDIFMKDILKNFGSKIGLAFQITDDILDAKSNFKTLGKKTNKDIVKNHLLNHISFNQAHKICTDLIYESTNRKSFFGEKNPFFKKFLNFLLERKY